MRNLRLKGLSVAPGLRFGPAFVLIDPLRVDPEASDIVSLEEALETVRDDLQAAAARARKNLGGELAEIFVVQNAILEDPELLHDLEEHRKNQKSSASQAVLSVFSEREERLRHSESAAARQHSDDVRDLARRLLRTLQGSDGHPLDGAAAGHVLIADRLLPSDCVLFSREQTVAVALEGGEPHSHAALFIRALGIPCVIQLRGLLRVMRPGLLVSVDGDAGTVLLDPSRRKRRTLERSVAVRRRRDRAIIVRVARAARSGWTSTIGVHANVGCREDVVTARDHGADGVGLFRIESHYLTRRTLPTEDELLDFLRSATEPMRESPLTVRLLDVGGDKPLPGIELDRDPNPALGRRGVRLLLAYPSLLLPELGALLRLSEERDLRVLVPFVTFGREMREVRRIASDLAAERGIGAIPSLGAMIETPAAALNVSEHLQHSDFVAIGSNDLAQYALAAGRDNELVSDYFLMGHASIFKLIALIGQQTKRVSTSICGELAADPKAVPRILRAGIGNLSVPPHCVPVIKEAVSRA